MYKIIFFICSLLALYPKVGQCQTEKRKALLIGNSKYVYYNKLSNSIRDVDSMAVALKALGFSITVKKDTEYRTMTAAVNTFVQNLQQDDIALLYYSGHGIGYNGNNFMLPIEEDFDCLNQLEELIPISLNRIVKNIENKGVKNSFVFLDACRNLPQFKNCDNSKSTINSTQGFVIPSNNPKGNLIFFATSEGSTANDDTYDKINSLFTSELLKYIRIPDLTIRNIVDKVINGVEQRSGYKQIPQKMEDLRGDFYFIKTSDEEKARIAAEYKKKIEDEIREKLRIEEEIKQIEINKTKKLEEENIAIEIQKKQELGNIKSEDLEKDRLSEQEIKAKDKITKVKPDIIQKPTKKIKEAQIGLNDYKMEIEFGDKAYQKKSYSGALRWYESAKKLENFCNECASNNLNLNQKMLDSQHNLEVKEYKNWKTTNKILLGSTLICLGAFTKHYIDFTTAKNDLTAKQRLADLTGQKIVYLSSNSVNNKAYSDYQIAYNKLENINDNTSFYNAVLIGGTAFGTTYLFQKVIGKKKPTNFKIIPLNKGLSLSFKI